MKEIVCKQGDDVWYKARMGLATASNFHRIVTPAKWAYAAAAETYIHQLVAEKYAPCYNVEDYVSAAMKNGQILEPEARRYYEFERGCDVQTAGLLLTDDGRFGYSPDGLVGDDGLLECKSPEPKTHVKWLLAGGVPAEHLAQCHGGLIVTGRDWIDFESYCHGLPRLLVRIEPNEQTTALRVALERFWTEYQAALGRVSEMFEPVPTRAIDLGAHGTLEISPYAEIPY